jgi:transposase
LTGGKKVKGRKRQIVVDSMGNLHQVLVHRANIHDSKGGAVLAGIVLKQQKKVKKMLADLGYRGFFGEVVQKIHRRKVEFSSKITGQFVIQPKRWIVERTIAWLNWARRLSKDFEQKCLYSENIIRISAIALTLKQLH